MAESKQRKVLITGGAGFIGSHLADALAAQGYKIKILDNLTPPVHTGKWPNYLFKKGYQLIRGDVREKKDWMKALKGVDYVFHFAAYQDQLPNFSKYFDVNTKSTALLYEIIVEKKLPIKKVILASTQFVYGDGRYFCPHQKKVFYPEPRLITQLKKKKWDIFCPHQKPAKFLPFKEEQTLNPPNSYALSKVALENLGLRLGKVYQIPTVILRYSIVQGPRQSPLNMYSGALRIFVSQALAKKPITVFEDGNQLRDFINIEDAIKATLLVFQKKEADFQIFNVGGGRGYKIIDFARMVKKITNSDSPILLRGDFRKTDTRHAVSDIKKLKKLGWQPKYTPEKSIREYLQWFKEEKFDNKKILKLIQKAQKELLL